MATDSTRTLTGQEVVVLMGDKDDAAGTFTLGVSGNISAWIEQVNPTHDLNTAARTGMGGGANALTRTQPTGLLTVNYQISWLGHPDVFKIVKPMVNENRLGQYLYPFKLVWGTAASDNAYEQCLGYLMNFTPSNNATSLVVATSTFSAERSYIEGQTAGRLT